MRVERTIDAARRQSPVLKTGRVTGPPSLPQCLELASAAKPSAPASAWISNLAGITELTAGLHIMIHNRDFFRPSAGTP